MPAWHRMVRKLSRIIHSWWHGLRKHQRRPKPLPPAQVQYEACSNHLQAQVQQQHYHQINYGFAAVAGLMVGNPGIIRQHTCPICFDLSFSHGHGELCWDCVNAYAMAELPSIIWKHLMDKNRLPANVIDLMEAYLLPRHDASAIFRKIYLRKMLLGPLDNPTPFRLLTYPGNGMAASISETEDIIDRVLAFAVTQRLQVKRVCMPTAPAMAQDGAIPIPAIGGTVASEADPTLTMPPYLPSCVQPIL